MHHVFVSYSRRDGAWVGDLVKRLEQRRIDAWIDQEDIPVTVPWLAEVRDSVEESALFLRCDSPAFRASASCSAEVGLAEQVGKPQFVVTVGTDLDQCAGQIAQTIGEISPARVQRTELRVLARDWDRAGRPRNRLVTRKARRRLSTGLMLPPPATSVERSFLRASTTRSRSLAAIATVVAALIAISLVAIVVLRTGQDAINSVNSKNAITSSQVQADLDLISQDPYGGLQAAAHDGGDESAVHAEVISQALRAPTPDNAFDVPQARTFAVRPVGAEVVVATASGREWRHPAAAAAVGQPATELPGSMAGVSPPARGAPVAASGAGLTASAGQRSGLVRVLKDGQLWRTIGFSAVPGALAFSPDGRFLAAAHGTQIEIADVRTAQVRIDLRGATGDLLDVAWSADGTHVWALDGGRVFSWLTGDAVTLVDDPAASYNSVLPAARPGAVWLVGAHTLTEITVTAGKTVASIALPDTLQSAGASPDGSLALVSGARYLWIVPLSGKGQPRHVTLHGCSLGRPAFASDTTAYQPCIGGSLLKLSLPSGAVAAVITTTMGGSGDGVFGVAVDPGSGTVYAGDEAGYLYVVRGSAGVPIQASQCDAEFQHIAIAPGDKAVLPVGSGSGGSTCTTIGLHAAGDPARPGSWKWTNVVEPQDQSIYASAVAFSPHGGSFAIGYSNGTITVHPTVNITPSLVDNTTDGMIRGMLTLPDGDLIVATDAGLVQRLRLCDSCISNAALSKVAAARLKLDERLGLARATHVPASR